MVHPKDINAAYNLVAETTRALAIAARNEIDAKLEYDVGKALLLRDGVEGANVAERAANLAVLLLDEQNELNLQASEYADHRLAFDLANLELARVRSLLRHDELHGADPVEPISGLGHGFKYLPV